PPSCFSLCSRPPRDLPSFPTRRSSDLVVVPPDDDRLRPLLEEPEDLLDLHPLVREVLRELVLEVPRDDQLLGLVRVEQAGEPLRSEERRVGKGCRVWWWA